MEEILKAIFITFFVSIPLFQLMRHWIKLYKINHPKKKMILVFLFILAFIGLATSMGDGGEFYVVAAIGFFLLFFLLIYLFIPMTKGVFINFYKNYGSTGLFIHNTYFWAFVGLIVVLNLILIKIWSTVYWVRLGLFILIILVLVTIDYIKIREKNKEQ